MTRSELIDRLINSRIDAIYQGEGFEQYLRELFAQAPQEIYGGYEHMDDDQLIEEWNECSDEIITELDKEKDDE